MTEQTKEYGIILYDGPCNLCSAIVKFVIRRDPSAKFRFAALDSETGKTIRMRMADASRDANADMNADDGLRPADTFLLVRGGKVYSKSRAGLEVIKSLSGVWPLLYMFIVVPAPLRDRVYDFIARRRYRWFGRNDRCLLPTGNNKDRFIVEDFYVRADTAE